VAEGRPKPGTGPLSCTVRILKKCETQMVKLDRTGMGVSLPSLGILALNEPERPLSLHGYNFKTVKPY
jgi:hypothetical protein